MKKIISSLALLAILALGAWLLLRLANNQPPPTWPAAHPEKLVAITNIVFTDPQSKENVLIAFDQENHSSTLSGLGYSNLLLKQASAANGARYLDATGTLEAWNRGQQITISKNGRQIFLGNVGGLSAAEKLIAHSWVWQATISPTKVIQPKNPTAFTLAFHAAEKRISASTDCNNIFGSYTIGANNALSFGPLGMTRKYCEGSQEQDFADGLAQVQSFGFDGAGQLVLELGCQGHRMLFTARRDNGQNKPALSSNERQ